MQEANSSCPVCLTPASLLQASNIRVDCLRCGRFLITEEALVDLRQHPLTGPAAAVASGWIAENSPTLITTEWLPRLRAMRAPSVQSRLDRLLYKLARDTTALGVQIDLRVANQMPAYISATYSQNEGEIRHLIGHLNSLCLVNAGEHWALPKVTPLGFKYVDEHIARNRESPVGFCAMWFDSEVLPLWNEAIAPAISDAGYEPKRIDNVEHNNRIDEEILAWIRRSRFVVADFTAQRHGVYFEAGFAMGLGLSVIWMIREDHLQSTHFDNRQYNFIVWRAEELGEAKRRLWNRIEATIGRGPRVAAP